MARRRLEPIRTVRPLIISTSDHYGIVIEQITLADGAWRQFVFTVNGEAVYTGSNPFMGETVATQIVCRMIADLERAAAAAAATHVTAVTSASDLWRAHAAERRAQRDADLDLYAAQLAAQFAPTAAPVAPTATPAPTLEPQPCTDGAKQPPASPPPPTTAAPADDPKWRILRPKRDWNKDAIRPVIVQNKHEVGFALTCLRRFRLKRAA